MISQDTKFQAAQTLRRAGIRNPNRLKSMIQNAIAFLGLDLSGFTVLTEAASGPYVVTPIIAALAGADRVLSITRNSQYAKLEEVIAQTRAVQDLCNLEDRVEIHTRRTLDLFAEADIVTNLGFIRPIDAEAVTAMKSTAVIPLMCEPWEFRSGDIDLESCRQKGIPVLGTNEDYPGLEIFSYNGWLCLKMLFDAQIEVHKSKIIVISSDKFGVVIERQLTSFGVSTRLESNLRNIPKDVIVGADVLVVADYSRDDIIIGAGGDMAAVDLARVAPAITVIQFAGLVDKEDLSNYGITVYPAIELSARRMSLTLAGLGPRPVIDLHSAGLKVGQALAEARKLRRYGLAESIKYALAHSPSHTDINLAGG